MMMMMMIGDTIHPPPAALISVRTQTHRLHWDCECCSSSIDELHPHTPSSSSRSRSSYSWPPTWSESGLGTIPRVLATGGTTSSRRALQQYIEHALSLRTRTTRALHPPIQTQAAVRWDACRRRRTDGRTQRRRRIIAPISPLFCTTRSSSSQHRYWPVMSQPQQGRQTPSAPYYPPVAVLGHTP